jgi:hypothetical protein
MARCLYGMSVWTPLKGCYRGILSATEIEAYEPDAKVTKKREQWRVEYIARVLHVGRVRNPQPKLVAQRL